MAEIPTLSQAQQMSSALRWEAWESSKPRDVLRKVTPRPYDPLLDVPPSIGEFASAYSQAIGHDVSGVIVAAVTAAASVISDNYKLAVRPESNWIVSARQWTVLIGGPSTGKSPAIKAATDHLKHMHNVLLARWQEETKDLRHDEKPPAPALFSSDATVAALSERLQGNQRGFLMLNEEFASWVGAIDSGDRGEANKNRGDWLQLRDGGPRQIDRIGRGSVFVPNWGVSVLAACTPDGLAKQMKHMPEDGLIQRFVPAVLAAPNLDATGDARRALATWAQWLEWAYGATGQGYGGCIRMSEEASEAFDEEVKEIKKLVIATEVMSPAYAAHLGKHPGMLAEVALIFHVFLTAQDGRLGSEVGINAMAYAKRYMQKVRRHAYALYTSILSSAPPVELAQAIARSIVASESVLHTISRDWMTQHCQGFKKADDRLRREAVQFLEDADWLKAQAQARSYGGWPSQYAVDHRVFQMFAREGELWRARRAAVKDMIAEAE